MDRQHRAKGYHYGNKEIKQAIGLKLDAGTSFRAVGRVMNLVWGGLAAYQAPSPSTVLEWVKKVGYYELHKKPIKQAQDWVIFIDESVQLGGQKLLLIYGQRASEFSFTQPLKLTDVQALGLYSAKSWTRVQIKEVLAVIEIKVGKIAYVVADRGSNIRSALRESGRVHVFDLTHQLASCLEHTFGRNAHFKAYSNAAGQMKRAMCLNAQAAALLPPNQRCNARFLNIEALCDWGDAVLDYLKQPIDLQDPVSVQLLAWVMAYRSLIEDLSQARKLLQEVSCLLKHRGLNGQTLKDCHTWLKPGTQSLLLEQFKAKALAYLHSTRQLLPEQKNILCCSDIIESAFGKYKNYLPSNKMCGITDLALCLAAFTAQCSEEYIQTVCESVHSKELRNWVTKHFGESLLQKRRKFFKPKLGRTLAA